MKAGTRILRGGQWARTLQQSLEPVPEDVMAWMARRATVLKSDQHSRVGMISLRGQPCFLKYYRSKSPLQGLLFRLGLARGVRGYDMAGRLLDEGLAVPRPLACLLAGDGLLLLNEGLPDGIDLKSLWLQRPDADTLHDALRLAGTALARLHQAGYSHGDCKWSNFLLGEGKVYLVDLENVRRARFGQRRCARDLARFTLNAEDMGLAPDDFCLFLDSYSSGVGRDRDALAGMIRPALLPLREKHRRKYGQRGHRLL